jgi:hypothetical protein
MSLQLRRTLGLDLVAILAIGSFSFAQTSAPTNSLPNPYRTIENWGTLPQAEHGARPARSPSIRMAQASGSASAAANPGRRRALIPGQPFACGDSNLDPILKFDPSGKLLKSFGAGLLLFPHGLYVDREGNVWVTDGLGRGSKGPPGFSSSAPTARC